MIAISASLTIRIRNDFSSLSAICPAVAGKKKKRQDEQRLGEIRKSIRVEPAQAGCMKGDEYDQGVLVNVVVEGAEELRQEKREKAPLPEQLVLIGLTHGFLCPSARRGAAAELGCKA